MKRFYTFFDLSYGYARAIIAFCLGLSLIIWPEQIQKYIIYILGGLIFLVGAISLILSLTGKWKSDEASLLTMNAIVEMAFGLVLICFPTFFLGIIMFLFGFVLLLFGISEIVVLIRSLKSVHFSWVLFIGPVLTSACGFIIFLNIFPTLNFLFIFFGAALLIYSISEFISTYRVRMALKTKQTIDSQSTNKPLD